MREISRNPGVAVSHPLLGEGPITFLRICGRRFTSHETERLHAGVLKAYRWQYIVSGVEDPRFMGTPEQADRIGKALAPIVG